ncbi:MAG: hypothetical protein M3O70_12940, partial [Actinomycetota bacterium]|nr:hypothetical protein [Actinomycetota bacterium]
VRALGLLSVIGPLDLPGMTEGMGASPRAAYALARRAPWALGLVVGALATAVRRNPERAGRQITKTRPPADRAIIERPDVYALLLEALPQNLAHPTSVTHEFSLQVQPWGFSASEVRVPTVVWQGGADSVHPPVMGRYLAAAIPGADLVYDEKGTAFTFLDDAQDVLTRLLVAWGDRSR